MSIIIINQLVEGFCSLKKSNKERYNYLYRLSKIKDLLFDGVPVKKIKWSNEKAICKLDGNTKLQWRYWTGDVEDPCTALPPLTDEVLEKFSFGV